MFSWKKPLSFRWGMIGVIALLFLGLLAFGANAQADSTPSSSPQQISQKGNFSSSQPPAIWMTQPTDLRGKVVHFSQISSSYAQGAQGVGDGREILGDIWEIIDSNGQVTSFHGVYTSPDGQTFYQEIFENTSTRLVIIGKHTPGIPAAWFTANQCTMQSPATVDELVSLLPPFEDEQSLNAYGFGMHSGVRTKPPVVTPLRSGISPLETYSASGNTHIWTKAQPFQNSFTQTQQEEIGAQNRTLSTSNKITDKTGAVVNSTQTDFGAMYVYSSSVVPSSIFTFPQTTGGCTR